MEVYSMQTVVIKGHWLDIQSTVFKHINGKFTARKRCGRTKRAHITKIPAALKSLRTKTYVRVLERLIRWIKASRNTTHKCINKVDFNCCISLVEPFVDQKGWRKNSVSESKLPEIQWDGPTDTDDLTSCVICNCLQGSFRAFMLPSADRFYGDTDLILQQYLEPANTAKDTDTAVPLGQC